MAHKDRKMVCKPIEGVLLRLEDGLLSRFLKILCRELDILMIVCGVVWSVETMQTSSQDYCRYIPYYKILRNIKNALIVLVGK